MSKADDLLDAYLCATDEDSEKALTRLCTELLLPVCRSVVRARLWRHDEDAQDVTQDVVLKLVRRAREVRVSGAQSSIRDATRWVMGAASNACSDFLRKKHPIRTHLAIALRYRLEKSVAFPLWKMSNGRMVCGWHRCRAVPPLTEPAFQEVLASPRVSTRLVGIQPEYSFKLWRAIRCVFACANGPIYFQSLISELLSRSLKQDGWVSDIEGIAEPTSEARTDDFVIQNTLLETLWRAIMTLPLDERCALLLNLRGPEGLAVWWQHNVVPRVKIADAVGLPPEELDRLPLSDLEIADILNLEELDGTKRRQRVINLRRTAKRRLSGYLDVS